MDNKYYTPKIEEFHVGFEYEYFQRQMWTKETLHQYDTLGDRDGDHGDENPFYSMDHGKQDRFRVKWLDIEDCESLGWEYDNNLEEIPSLFTEHGRSRGYNIDTQPENGLCYCLHVFEDGYILVWKIKDCGSDGYIFQGIVKNKSKLKRLMEQLGI